MPLSPEERERVRLINQRSARRAADVLRMEELRRVRDLRSHVIASVNNQPVRVEDVVEGGRLYPGALPGERGVAVSSRTRLGRIGYWRADRERASGSALSLSDIGHSNHITDRP